MDKKAKKFVIMQWADGWREVAQVEDDVTDIRRYFVIERIEYFGRLVTERPAGIYPDVIVTDRKPLEMSRIALVGRGECKLSPGDDYKEGDRVEHNFALESNGDLLVEELRNEVKRALARKSMTVSDVRKMAQGPRRAVLGEVLADLRLVGKESQEDALECVEVILQEGA